MTASTDRHAAPERDDGPLDSRWRTAALAAQEAALPDGDVVVTCSAPLGVGGLGRHLGEVLGALERRGTSGACISGSTRAVDRDGRERLHPTRLLARTRAP